MFELFINFITETNLLASIFICISFLIFSVGILAPCINFIINIMWGIIDDSEMFKILWVCEKMGKTIRKLTKGEVSIYEHNYGYYVIVGDIEEVYYSYDVTQGLSGRCELPYRTKNDSKEEAEDTLKSLNGSLLYYTGYIVLAGCITMLISLLAADFLWPLIYIISALGSLVALRSLRRLQKKTNTVLQKLKDHEALKDAHK